VRSVFTLAVVDDPCSDRRNTFIDGVFTPS
jgi:hypothetical protein